ncbi:MAG: preprotein translocase subunit YajC [Gammaproteobacteria bacterium]
MNLAWAQETAAGAPDGGGAIAQFLPLVLIIVVFYFLLIRPQQKRAKQHREMIGALAVGDEVVTSGGIFGKITAIGDNSITVNIGAGEIKLQKQAVGGLLPRGSLDKS